VSAKRVFFHELGIQGVAGSVEADGDGVGGASKDDGDLAVS
jgi:hypothetical protein